MTAKHAPVKIEHPMQLLYYDRERFEKVADIFAVLLAASLPWSTSATGILAVLWLLAFIPSCDVASLRRIVSSPAGAWPLALVAFGAVGLLWADVSWAEGGNGLSSFLKLLCIPLLMTQFGRSERAHHVLIGFFGSCILLLILSWAIFFWPRLPFVDPFKTPGVPVKDYFSQGVMFTICLAIALQFAADEWRAKRRGLAAAMMSLAILFVANILYIATSRTFLVVLPVVLVLFGYRQFGWKGIVASAAAFCLLVAAAWPSADYLRVRVNTFADQIRSYHPEGPPTPAGERLVFWTKSIEFMTVAPVFGHGTGSIKGLFERSTAGRSGMAAEASTNPHNQMLAVGIQLGIAGIAVLLAMWLSHLLLFRAPGAAGWIGLIVVVQNIVGSQFNSHLFDFTQGWAYVVGVGIAGGVVLKQSARSVAEAR